MDSTAHLLTPDLSLATTAVTETGSCTNGVEKKRSKRKKKRSPNGSADASGTSTPRPAVDQEGTGELGRAIGPEPQDSMDGPGGQVGSSRAAPKAANTSFADEDEFIAFDFGSDDDDEGMISFATGTLMKKDSNGHVPDGTSRSKGKERARDDQEDGEVKDDRSPDPFPQREPRKLTRQERRELERKEARGRKRSRSRSPTGGREWDRGKRKTDRYDYGSTSKAPWVRGLQGLEDCKNVAEMMHREVEAFTTWISPSPIEDEIRGLIVKQIYTVVKARFPDASVLPFGSYETKLYLPLGDIDLVIISESMAWSDKVTVLHALANTLKRAGITSRVSIIAKARVPIVKFVTTHGRFNVDISINQESGLVSGTIVNGFLKNLHSDCGSTSMALRSLILITKAFLAQRGMNEVYTGGLGSYSIVCLAVSFLQMHPKIRRGEIDPDQNLGVLVMEFFELYGCYFNYDEVGISVRGGGTYLSKRQRGWFDYTKRGLLSIEDPADPSNDISKGSYGFNKVRTALAGAHSILTSTAYLRAGIINARRTGQSIHLRSHYEPEDLSILSTVMGITQETLNHRRLVQELYDQRMLHKLLDVRPGTYNTSFWQQASQPSGSGSWNQPPPPSSKLQPKELRIQGAAKKAAQSSDMRENNEKDVREAGSRLDGGDDEDDEEGGRYDIGQPPRKRQRTGHSHADHHTVFVTDDDEDDVGSGSEVEGEEDEGRYRHLRDPTKEKARDPVRAREEQEKNDKRRSYWLSKGIGPGLGGDGHSD